MKRFALAAALFAGLAVPAAGQDIPADYQQVLSALGKQGDYKANVLKVNIPRNDVTVTVANVKTPTPFGFGGWIAMTKGTGGMDLMMGDLVLTQDEVNPARPAATTGSSAPQSTLDTAKIAQIVGTPGEQSGAVYKITIGRDDVKLVEMGAAINARMGLNTWAAFVGTNDNAAMAGDVAMLASEVTPVLKILRKNGLDVVAIHHHMIDTRPTIYFLHYWGTGPAEKLATGFKAALGELGKPKSGTPSAK